MNPIATITAIIDGAGPPPDPQALMAQSEAATGSPARARARKDQSSDGEAGRPINTSLHSAEDVADPVQPSQSASPPPRAAASSITQGDRSCNATLAGPVEDLSWMDEEEPIEDALAYCAELGENDVDNGKRLRRYLGRELLAIAQAGEEVGAWLCWSGRHWDIDGGPAGVNILAQTIGDLIAQEEDFIVSTPFERDLIDAAEAAQVALDRLADELAEIDPKDRGDVAVARRAAIKAEGKELSAIVKRGTSAKGAMLARKISRRDFANQSKNAAKVANMRSMAGPHVRQPPEAFNADQLLVATLTHTLRFERVADLECPDPDVTRFKARVIADAVHRRSDMLTAMVPISYDQAARGPRWERFLDRCMPAAGKRRTIQAFAGLGLLGIPVQWLMFHYGTGANGKSVFLEVITRALGTSFAVGLPVESVTGMAMGTGGQASPDIARLFGKRMLRVHELPPGALLRAEVIKKLTGGEKMTARPMYEGFFEFQPIAKPHMSGNDFPQWDGSDGGMRRRLILAHWDVTIPEHERRDFEEFVSELLQESSAILSWLIAGALDYLENGLVIDEEVRADTARYADEMDPVGQFAGHCLEPCQGHNEKARDVFLAYKAWSEANAKRVMSETRFGKILKKKIPFDDTKRIRVYLNVRLHDVPEEPNADGRAVDYQHGPPPHGGDSIEF